MLDRVLPTGTNAPVLRSDYQSVRSLWRELYKKVQVPAGRGVESFVALKRKDGTEDYGYQLSIRSEPGAENRPDLMMYVIRDAVKCAS